MDLKENNTGIQEKYKQLRLHELSPLEAVRKFTDFYKSCLNRKTIKKKGKQNCKKAMA